MYPDLDYSLQHANLMQRWCQTTKLCGSWWTGLSGDINREVLMELYNEKLGSCCLYSTLC